MTESNHTEGVNTTDESMEDSAVIKALRKQIKDLEAALKTAPTRDSIEAEIRTTLERETAIAEQLVALGHPAGMSAILKEKLGEGEVTRESVADALKGIGYQVEVDGAAPESQPEPSIQSDLAQVANLSAQVRSAAQGVDLTDAVSRKIAAAKTPAELAAAMEEAGLSDSLL